MGIPQMLSHPLLDGILEIEEYRTF
jgi:hypothetical protein